MQGKTFSDHSVRNLLHIHAVAADAPDARMARKRNARNVVEKKLTEGIAHLKISITFAAQ